MTRFPSENGAYIDEDTDAIKIFVVLSFSFSIGVHIFYPTSLSSQFHREISYYNECKRCVIAQSDPMINLKWFCVSL